MTDYFAPAEQAKLFGDALPTCIALINLPLPAVEAFVKKWAFTLRIARVRVEVRRVPGDHGECTLLAAWWMG